MNVTLEKHNENLAEVAGLLTDEKQCAVTIAPDHTEIQQILDEQKKKTTEAFKVLVVGAFNAGKSSMINALAGRDNFLPTGSLPETGVITELIYGEQYRITLYPKEGSGITEPIVLVDPAEEVFKNYCSIDNQASINGSMTSNLKYERVVVECDIPLLKEGIMLIDTVGMNDPWGNDYITERYFPKADAIIYLMDATRIYTADDKRLLTRINDYGFRDLIIVYTHFSAVVQQNRRKPQSVMDEFCDVARRHAANHTDIGDMGIHFIDSLDGLDGKLDGDHDKVVRSGICDLEKFYTRYLIANKGRMKVQTLNHTMHKLADELSSLSDKIKIGANTDISDLKDRISAADQELEIIEQNVHASVARFMDSVQNTRSLLEASITNHVGQLANKVNLDDYSLMNQLPRGMAKFVPGRDNKMAAAIQAECQNELSRRMKDVNTEWIRTDLGNQLSAIIKEGIEEIGKELFDFYVQMDEIDSKLSDVHKKEKTKRTITDIVAGVGFTLLTGDPITGAVGVTYGAGAMGKAVIGNVLVNSGAMLAAAMGVPVAIPVLIAANVIAHIIAILATNNEKREQKLKNDIVADFRKAYSEAINDQRSTVEGILNSCNAVIEAAGDQLKAMLQQELDKKRRDIFAMRSVAEKSVTEKAMIIKKNEEALATLELIREQGNAIAAQYN